MRRKRWSAFLVSVFADGADKYCCRTISHSSRPAQTSGIVHTCVLPEPCTRLFAANPPPPPNTKQARQVEAFILHGGQKQKILAPRWRAMTGKRLLRLKHGQRLGLASKKRDRKRQENGVAGGDGGGGGGGEDDAPPLSGLEEEGSETSSSSGSDDADGS